MRKPYDRIRVPDGSAAATAVLLVTAWAPFVFGIDTGPTPALVQSGLYVGLFVLTTVAPRVKIRLVRTVQRWVVNPVVRLLFASNINPLGLAILETRGRISGRPRRTPVGNGRSGDDFWIIAEHGWSAGYVRNIVQNNAVRVRLRVGWRYRWIDGVATVRPDDDPLARQRRIAAWHPLRAINAVNVRAMGADLLSVHIALSMPSKDRSHGVRTALRLDTVA